MCRLLRKKMCVTEEPTQTVATWVIRSNVLPNLNLFSWDHCRKIIPDKAGLNTVFLRLCQHLETQDNVHTPLQLILSSNNKVLVSSTFYKMGAVWLGWTPQSTSCILLRQVVKGDRVLGWKSFYVKVPDGTMRWRVTAVSRDQTYPARYTQSWGEECVMTGYLCLWTYPYIV